MSSLKEDLTGRDIELIETHTAWVFLGRERVLKVKKPVDFGFLNFTTLERRKAACEAEVRLNARLAPRVYQGVVPIMRDALGAHRPNGDGSIVDYAVCMQRLPDGLRADVLLGERRLGFREIDALAEHLAGFHASLESTVAVAAPFGASTLIAQNVSENFEQARAAVRDRLSEREADEIESVQRAFLEEKRALFEARVQKGRVRDGHGDLRLEHVYFESPSAPTIIDCIEFNDRFRYADVCCDIAFLSMDLRRMGRPDLAERFILSYARASGDYELYRLVDFYEAYRAYVRGKVAAMLARDREVDVDARQSAERDSRSFFLLSLIEGRRSLLEPALVAVGGFIASGKSTVSERIGELMNSPVISADRTRKELLGVPPEEAVQEAPWTGAYSAGFSEKVHSELLLRAGHVLASGRPVVLDTTFQSRELREKARNLARAHGVRFFFVECKATVEECKRRLAERARSPSVSDGRLEIFDDFLERFEPVTELASAEYIAVDTTLGLDVSIQTLKERLPTWPEGFTG